MKVTSVRRISIGAICLVGIGIVIQRPDVISRIVKQRSFEAMATGFAIRFGAPEIMAEHLLERLRSESPTLLVDVREGVEQDISILPRAVRADPRMDLSTHVELQRFAASHGKNPDAKIVLYCAGGYRSARSYAALPPSFQKMTMSLHGGIVGFVNAGGIVVDASGSAVQAVHTYNAMWAAFVNPPIRAVTEPKVP